MDVITVPSPDCYAREPGENWEDCTAAACSRRWRSCSPARRRDLRGDRRAAGAVRRRHAHVPPGVPAAAARGLRPPRRAPDRRRDRGRLRPHRHAVRLRAGRHHAGLPLPVEGPHRRLPAAVGGAHRRATSTRPSTTSTRSCAPSCIRTATPATRSPARRRSRRSTSSPTDDVIERNRALAAHLGRRARDARPTIRTSPRCASTA